MTRILILCITIILTIPSLAISAEADFFGSLNSLFTINENLKDASSKSDDKMDYMATQLVFGLSNRFNDNLRGVVAFEVGGMIWGVNGENYPVGRNAGGAVGGDAVNVETKNVYIDVNSPDKSLSLSCGLMPFDIADGILAGDDAFGTTITLKKAVDLRLNLIRVYQDSLGTSYDYNSEDSDRRENFFDLEVSHNTANGLNLHGLFGALIDRYNGDDTAEVDRDIYYLGLGITEKDDNKHATIDLILNRGSIKNSDVPGATPIDTDVNGYLVNVSGSADYLDNGFTLQFLYASGDDPMTADKNEGFIVPETSYKTDIAEILTRGILSDELEGDEDYAAYQFIPRFSNVYFIKAAVSNNVTKKTEVKASLIYAGLPREKFIDDAKTVSAKKIGTELDLELTHTIYKAADMKKGLELNIIAAILFSGDAFDEYDSDTGAIVKGNNIYEYGVRLSYEF